MRTTGTVLGMALIGFLLQPIVPPTDWPGHGLDGQAYASTAAEELCDEVVAYNNAVSTCDGYGNTYYYKKLVWMDARDLFNRSKINWVEHVNEDCEHDPKCDGFGPADGCTEGEADWNAYQESKSILESAYVDMEDAWDDWEDGVAICGVIKLVMLNHCQSCGCEPSTLEPEEPVR